MKAQEYFDRIPDGHQNAMKRPWDTSTDRVLRKMIEKANNDGDCIINVGEGIYRPVPGNMVDEAQLNKYLGKELHRARAILFKRECMKQTFAAWKCSAEYSALQRKERNIGKT